MTSLILLALGAAVGVFFLAQKAGYGVVNRVYLSDEATAQRVSQTLGEFQSYVKLNNLTSTDLSQIAGWTMKNGYVNILVFQNGHPKFEAGSWGYENLTDSENAKLYEDSANSYTFSPVSFSDGIFQVALDDYSYLRYYTLAEVLSIILAAVVMVVAVVL